MDLSGLKSVVQTRDDAQALLAVSWDSGRILFRAPRAVVRPRSPDEVAETIRWARRAGAPAAVRGMGHTQHGQSLVEGGVSIDTRCLGRIGALEGDTLEVEAGVTWRTVIAHLAKKGLLPPVLTNNIDTTVGGTISTGGIGTSSHCRGVQAGHVEALEAVTGRGEVVRCSRSENAGLFDATRCGLGQFSVITKATYPHPSHPAAGADVPLRPRHPGGAAARPGAHAVRAAVPAPARVVPAPGPALPLRLALPALRRRGVRRRAG